MRRDNRTYEARVAALDASITRGLADAEAGRLTPAAAVFDRLERKYGVGTSGRGRDEGPSPIREGVLTRDDD